MDDEFFCHGVTRQWVHAIGEMREVDGIASVSAEIRHSATVRCELLPTQQAADRKMLVALMRERGSAWIERAYAAVAGSGKP